MKAITHSVRHTYQPNNHSCGQAALSILLSFYERDMTPEAIMEQVDFMTTDAGETAGTTGQGLASWCIAQGFGAKLWSFDCQILDLAWAGLSKPKLLERLEAVKSVRNIPVLGERLSEFYVQGYIDYLEAGGELEIRPYATSGLLDELLETGPVLACVGFNTMYGYGRTNATGLRVSVPDDIGGRLTNHFVVIYGRTEGGDFLVADPWEKPGRQTIGREQMLAGISAAERECDNMVFMIRA
jgi:hypothetical protein